MRILFAAVLILGLAVSAMAIDIGGALDSASKAVANPTAAINQAAGSAANSTLDAAMAELTKKLKNSQNEYGPIVFKTGKADLNAKKCERTLKYCADTVKNYPGFLVQVDGHTDNKGNAKKNLTLSQKRAEAVVKYLADKLQVPANRLIAKGWGDAQPIADNSTAAGRDKNRRVDFTVTKQ